MNDIEYQIGSVSNSYHGQTLQNNCIEYSAADSRIGYQKTSSKYVLENNLIYYEKYDRHGRLVYRIPRIMKTIEQMV